MKADTNNWTKTELKIYILLLCANADSVETPKELRIIGTGADEKSFDRIYNEFMEDSEELRLEKIQNAIALHEYSHRELAGLKKEIHRIFMSDKNFGMRERNLDQLLDNIIY